MQFKMFAVSAHGADGEEELLNHYLRSHRVLAVSKEWTLIEERPYWCFCVETLAGAKIEKRGSGKNRIDYKEILSSSDFAVFAALRDLRKKISEEDAVPVFVIFTNEQLADIARRRPSTMQAFAKIGGIGPSRTEKYGAAVVALILERGWCANEELETTDRSGDGN